MPVYVPSLNPFPTVGLEKEALGLKSCSTLSLRGIGQSKCVAALDWWWTNSMRCAGQLLVFANIIFPPFRPLPFHILLFQLHR